MSTREQYLELAAQELRATLFEPKGFTVPKFGVSVGFPGGGKPTKRIGEHWSPSSSDSGISQIFINPILDCNIKVLGVLIHEMIHALYPKGGHGKLFKRCALSVGLTGQMRSTGESEQLKEFLKELIARIGAYPHQKINLSGGRKKQSTRMIKMECSSCGYIARTSQRNIENLGPVLCPCNSCAMTIL